MDRLHFFYFLKTAVCTGFGSTAESSPVFPAAATVGTSSPTVPGSEDEVGGDSMICPCVCVCQIKRRKEIWVCVNSGIKNPYTTENCVVLEYRF